MVVVSPTQRPTGHTYSTEPHGGTLFPAVAQPTGDLGEVMADEASADRGVMMPTRKQTRERDRRDRIAKERRERTELIAERERESAGRGSPPPTNRRRSVRLSMV